MTEEPVNPLIRDNFDQDAFNAALDLIHRAGAIQLEFGYLNEDVPIPAADWYATATYQGAKVIVEHHVGPVEAVEALARRLLAGGICTYCTRVITLSGGGGKKVCRWRRHADRWVRGCTDTHPDKQMHIKKGNFRP